MKITDRKAVTGSHEAKKVETKKEEPAHVGRAEQATVTQQLSKSGFSSGPGLPNTTPPGVPNAPPAGSMKLEALPHDPDVSMGRWLDKHATDGAKPAPAKETQAVGDKAGVEAKKLLMCPVLGSLVAEGSLDVDQKGNVSLKQLNDVMINRLGITPERAAVTVSTATIGNHFSDLGHVLGGKMNLNHLGGSALDHRGQGDTGILMGGEFHEDKFSALIGHSSDGKTMTVEDFGRAIKDQLKRDGGGVVTNTKGRSEDLFEMAALINTFGYTDDKGVRRIDFETMRSLYRDQKLPSKEQLMSRKATGVAEHLDSMAKMTKGLNE